MSDFYARDITIKHKTMHASNVTIKHKTMYAGDVTSTTYKQCMKLT